MYKAFIKILPDEIYCEIIQDNDYLMFQLLDDKDERTIYHIPCKIIDEAKGVLREIYICFFSLLCKTQGIEKLTDNPIYEIYTFDLPKEGEEIDKDDEWMVTLNEYENGKIAQTLKTVFEKPKYTIRQLKNRIKKYVPADERESKILSRMSEGLELFKVGKNIMNYAFFPKEDEDFYDSYYPVPITRFFNIIYEFHDLVSENLNQWISDNANENGYEYLVGAEDIISPQTKALLKADDYVEKFLKWINDFCDELHD